MTVKFQHSEEKMRVLGIALSETHIAPTNTANEMEVERGEVVCPDDVAKYLRQCLDQIDEEELQRMDGLTETPLTTVEQLKGELCG